MCGCVCVCVSVTSPTRSSPHSLGFQVCQTPDRDNTLRTINLGETSIHRLRAVSRFKRGHLLPSHRADILRPSQFDNAEVRSCVCSLKFAEILSHTGGVKAVHEIAGHAFTHTQLSQLRRLCVTSLVTQADAVLYTRLEIQ